MSTEKSEDKALASPSNRQNLTKHERDRATRYQTATIDNTNQPRYDVPYGRTPDENNTKFKNYAASFHKLLEHDPDTGLLTDSGATNGVDSYKNLLKGLKIDAPSSDFDQDSLNKINLAYNGERRRVLINPQSGKALTIKGGDSAAYSFKQKAVTHNEWEVGYEVVYAQGEGDKDALLRELSFSSGYSAAEMVEVYAMALLRDLNFEEYSTAYLDVRVALKALNAFGNDFRGPKERQADGSYKVTVKTLFRGNSPESLRGDYLSKFYLLRRPPQFASGCAPGVANLTNAQIFFNDFADSYLVPPPNPQREFALTWDDYVELQNGRIPDLYQVGDFFKPKVLISDGRILGSSVHVDSLYQEHAWAVDILTGGDYPRTPVSPYTRPPVGSTGIHAKNEGDGPTLGPPDAAGLVGAVALEAARAAWGVKYLVARRARPEVFGALIHKRLKGGDENTYGPIDSRLLTNADVRPLLERVRQENRRRGGAMASTYLLSQLFPEGSPAHPAWTSGHATVAGACVTVIKAIFDDTALLRQQITGAPPFRDNQGNPLTVGGELDKLASNIALGRNFGGVHFRSDGEHGILLGEAVGIHFLQDHLRTYRERFRCNTNPAGTDPCFVITKRSGERVRITAEDVTPVTALVAKAITDELEPEATSDRSIL
jgi:hypothetical protein